MSVAENRKVVHEFFSAMSNGNLQGALNVLDVNIVWTIIGDTPVSKTFRGLKDLEENLVKEIFRCVNPEAGIFLEVIETISEGDKVVARVEGTVEGKYGPYNNTYCHVFTVNDGKIIENMEYLDTTLIHKSWYGKTLS
jgi:ketosteroid isomerase-like protein